VRWGQTIGIYSDWSPNGSRIGWKLAFLILVFYCLPDELLDGLGSQRSGIECALDERTRYRLDGCRWLEEGAIRTLEMSSYTDVGASG
jgi:hypothetical protein